MPLRAPNAWAEAARKSSFDSAKRAERAIYDAIANRIKQAEDARNKAAQGAPGPSPFHQREPDWLRGSRGAGAAANAGGGGGGGGLVVGIGAGNPIQMPALAIFGIGVKAFQGFRQVPAGREPRTGVRQLVAGRRT